MNSSAACATGCAVPNVDESNHSAAGITYATLHRSATFSCTCPRTEMSNSPFLQKNSHLTVKKSSSSPPDPPPQTIYIGIDTLNCCNYFCTINSSELVYSHLDPWHFNPWTYQSLTLTFILNLTLTLLTILTPQPPASILHTSRAQEPKCLGTKWPHSPKLTISQCEHRCIHNTQPALC